MNELLKNKYGKRFLEKAQHLTDSLESLPNWKNDPSFPGGIEKMFEFVSNNTNWSKFSNQKIKQKTSVIVTITKEGELIDIQAVKSTSKKFSKEAIRVVKLMPKWEPAHLYGEPIKVQYVIPIYQYDNN